MESIVLARSDVLRPFDERITLYTRDAGKRELFARGVKRMVSKNSPHLEIGTHLYAASVHGKELAYLTSVQPITLFSNIRTNSRKSLFLQKALSDMNILFHVGEQDERVFLFLSSWISSLDEMEPKNVSLSYLDFFYTSLLVFLGHAPRLDQCVISGEEVNHEEKVALSLTHGGVICSHCLETRVPNMDRVQMLFLSKEGREILDAYEHHEYSVDVAVPVGSEIHTVVHTWLRFSTEQGIKDWAMIDRIIPMTPLDKGAGI